MIEQAEVLIEGLEGATVVRFEGREAMNELSAFTLDVLTDDAFLDPQTLVDKEAVVAIADAAAVMTKFHLIVVEASCLGHFRGQEKYRVVLAPAFGRLTLRVNHEVFQEKTTQEITKLVLERSGFPASLVKWRLAGQYAKRDYVVQYGESEWAFITRLLADEGINCWFDRKDEETCIVFGDHPSSHDGIEGEHPTVPFQDQSGMNASAFAFQSLRRTDSIVSTKVSLRDVNVQNPAVPIDGEAGDGDLEVFEYPSGLVIAEAAKARAKVRLEQHRRHRSVLKAESQNARIQVGRVVEIFGAADDCFSGKFLITAVEHQIEQASREGGRAIPYRNSATLVPVVEETPYRPAIPNDAPSISGMESAIVTGPSGEEIHVDDLGRVKVRFFWDRSGVRDDKSSCWVRTLQMNLFAPQIIPRVGWEVSVVYENGDPDRPFVLGRLYNGGARTPYDVPDQKATSTFQSATSPSDGTTQEIRFSDDAGHEEVFVHATRDQSVVVGGSHTVKVGANRSDDVKKSQSIKVDGSQTTNVGGNQAITVGANGLVAVSGARSESIGGNESIGVTGSYSIAVSGAYTETIGGLYALQCNQSNATIQGAFTQVIGGALSTTAGLGSNQSVAGARVENVGGARMFTAAAAYADGTTGSKRITAGAASEQAGADMAWTAGARMQVQAGGALSIDAGGKVVFEAATITIKAATLIAKGGATMKLAGSMKSSSTVKLDAPMVKKTKKVKVEG